ncbi:MAG: hypothetical protein M1269_10000 [Chloroflexi bacterium]|nr:hypothetical protein [Chloroflexota bacterium]
MYPGLTEGWASAYIAILIPLLIFMLGATFALQTTVPEDLQCYIHSRQKLWFYYIPMAALVLVVICFIWLFHPTQEKPVSQTQHLISAFGMTIIFILLIIFWVLGFRELQHPREKIVQRLENESARTILHKGFLEEKSLNDIIYLGKRGETGYDKGLSINAFGNLAKKLQESDKYRGAGLEQLVMGIEEILIDGENKGNDSNFCQAAEVLKDILLHLENRNLLSSSDTELTLRTLERLGIATIKLCSDSTMITFLEVIKRASELGDVKLEQAIQTISLLGSLALDSKKYLIAAAALSKLEALAEQNLPVTADKNVDLLGLLAHFWTAGETTRKQAKETLSLFKNSFSPSLRECLISAIKIYTTITQFDTADKLAIMEREIE